LASWLKQTHLIREKREKLLIRTTLTTLAKKGLRKTTINSCSLSSSQQKSVIILNLLILFVCLCLKKTKVNLNVPLFFNRRQGFFDRKKRFFKKVSKLENNI